MANKNLLVVSTTLEVVTEIPTPVMNHIEYVANSMIGKSNLVEADKSDIIQDMSIAVINAIPSIKITPKYKNGNAYLNKVVDITAKNIYRKRIAKSLDIAHASIDECLREDDMENVKKQILPIIDNTNMQNLCFDIQEVLSKLSPDLLEICQLIMGGYTYKEISQITGIAEPTIRIWRMQKIRSAFAEIKKY